MTALICERCGGQINPDTMTCVYCDTAYTNDYKKRMNMGSVTEIMTPNECRRMMGLKPIDVYDIYARKICELSRKE